jgi:hypothetical protein
LFAATPMTLYFGGFPDVIGMPLVFLSIVAVLAYLRFQRAPGWRTFIWCTGAFTLAGLCDWPAYMLVPVFVAHFAATRPRREWPWIAGFAGSAAILFIGLYAYITIATHNPWTWMVPLFQRRSALAGGSAYTTRQWLAAAFAFNRTYHTVPLLVVGAISIVMLAVRRVPTAAGVAWLLLGWAAIYIVVGSKALYDHDWPWCLLTPGLVVAAAIVIERLPARAIVATLLAFAAWTTWLTAGYLYPAQRHRSYTPTEIGNAIRAAAPAPNDVALLVGNDMQAQLWWHGDRPLRTGIWSVDELERRLDDATVDVMFNFDEQPWHARATGLVFPKMWRNTAKDLARYVDARYQPIPLPPDVARSFDVFDLRANGLRTAPR